MTSSAPAWIQLLGAATPPYLDRLSEHSDFQAWHVDLSLNPWTAAPGGKLTREESYGWKPQLIPSDPRLAAGLGRSVGEVELACRLRAAGYEAAAWTDGFGSAPEVWNRWIRRPLALPASIRRIDEQVRAGNPDLLRDTTAAWPDVVAYRDTASVSDAVKAAAAGDLVFAEYKGPSLANARKSDTISETQDLWVRTAIGRRLIPLTGYVVVRWRPSPAAREVLDRQWASCDRAKRGNAQP